MEQRKDDIFGFDSDAFRSIFSPVGARERELVRFKISIPASTKTFEVYDETEAIEKFLSHIADNLSVEKL